MKASGKLLLLLPLLLFVGLAIFLRAGLERDPQHLPSAMVGQAFPDFALSDLYLAARARRLSDVLGQPFLLNVWATWCPSCRVEHPMLLALQADGVRLVGLNYKDERDSAIAYLRQHQDPFVLSLFDPDGDLGFDLGVYGAPETFFVNANGIIQHKFVGVITAENWQNELKPIYDQMAR